ncbi:chromate resistance protein ChrB domain-containing protein [Deinococcus navajonensis]|uniref:Chromate resistance protein ChrB domain-containing protein n=1 Tax=Deinococcus navajonensis TaxID=309884 RepID=A0ABV8XR74_9DEIO
MAWLVLLSTLPSGGSSTSRVTLWRRLRRLGAVALPGGAAVLPDLPDQRESFGWLLQEVQQAGGEGAVLHVREMEGLTDAALRERFNAARADDYAELVPLLDELRGLLASPSATARARGLLERLHRRQAELQRLDFFHSSAGVQLAQALAGVERQWRAEDPGPPVLPADPALYQGRTWSTRPQPRVDRLASGWLIRRFIDPDAVLAYTEAPGPQDVSFDREEGGFTHVGTLCTFEVLVRAFGLHDPALLALADIVHELDLHDGRQVRPEVPGVEALLRGLYAAQLPDQELERLAHPLFESLYRALNPEVSRDTTA